ncbi:MAG: lipopolysaccharide biosynthesis protein [Acidobacteriaceae bacterium]|nr:lipopolysaccharide biosynthesis protein [Acidobacteriaceae bacterium]
MIENRVLTMDDYGAMLRRRLKTILVPTLLAPVVGFLISYAFPPKYTSQSLVLVEQQKVPQGYVAPVVTEDLSQRIATLEQKALGADRLRLLIDKLNQQGILHGANAEDVIDQIRSGVTIEPVQMVMVPNPSATKGSGSRPGFGPNPSKSQAQVPGFNLNYTAKNPHEAQAICAGVTDIMLQENLRDREQVAQNTTNFLTRQVEDAKSNLNDLDGKLAAFKRQYMGQLPGDADSNLKILTAMNSQLDATTQTLNRAQQDKTYTESLLAQQLAAWKSSQSASNPQTLQQQLALAQTQLISLQERYTDDYPDVVKTKKQIADLQKKLNEINSAAPNSSAPSGSQANATEPAEVQQLRMQVHQYEQVIAQSTRDEKNLQSQIKIFQGRVSLSPAIEQQYKQLTRDYDTAQKFYDDLLAKRTQSEMQTAMEREQQGEQMHLQIPAGLPDSPSFPNRLMFAGGGLGGGLALGVCLGLLLELRDKSLRNEGDVIAALELPVLSQVPWVGVETAGQNANGKRRLGFMSSPGNRAGNVEV